ncbi:MAG: DUF4312 family protein [Pseudolactococcus laudensis]
MPILRNSERRHLATMTTTREESVTVSGKGATKQSAFSDAISQVQRKIMLGVKMSFYRLLRRALMSFQQQQNLT